LSVRIAHRLCPVNQGAISYLLMLLVAVILALAVYLQGTISRRFQFKLLTRWHIGAMLVLLTAPTVSFFLYTTRCRSLAQLPLVAVIFGVFVIASVSLGRFNISRINLKYGVLATLVQMCAFALALTIGSVPAIDMQALLSMGAGGMHACV
ncbi:MAG: hypothetical protein V4476_28120, partial [Pseudomonadota bacterium]